jgi:hypothetical protein
MEFKFKKNDVRIEYTLKERFRILFKGEQKFTNESIRYLTNNLANMISHAHLMVDDKYKDLQSFDHKVWCDE